MVAAGAGAYYFAKKSVNADKRARFEEDMKRQRLRAEAREAREAESNARSPTTKEGKKKPHPEANTKSTPEQALENEAQKPDIAAQYLATKPYRSTKGDRFS